MSLVGFYCLEALVELEQNHIVTFYCIYIHVFQTVGFPGGSSGKEPACQCRRNESWIQSLGQEDPLEEDTATHSTIAAWRIPWTEESGVGVGGAPVHGVTKNRT